MVKDKDATGTPEYAIYKADGTPATMQDIMAVFETLEGQTPSITAPTASDFNTNSTFERIDTTDATDGLVTLALDTTGTSTYALSDFVSTFIDFAPLGLANTPGANDQCNAITMGSAPSGFLLNSYIFF